jgi:esterase/lipase superfamily enzyme
MMNVRSLLSILLFTMTFAGFAANSAPRTVTVSFATNRAYLAKKERKAVFDSIAGQKETYGEAVFEIPSTSTKGQIDEGNQTDKNKHVKLGKLELIQQRDEFFQKIKTELKEKGLNQVYVFIHDFNTEFLPALHGIPGMYLNLELSGIPVAYSWPSITKAIPMPSDFFREKAMIEYSLPSMKEFINKLREQVDVHAGQCLNIVGLPNFALSKLLESIAHDEEAKLELPNYKAPFCEILVTSKDDEAFQFFSEKFSKLSDRIKNVSDLLLLDR